MFTFLVWLRHVGGRECKAHANQQRQNPSGGDEAHSISGNVICISKNLSLCKTPRRRGRDMGKGRDAPNLVTHLIPQAAKNNKIFLPPMGEFPGRTGGTGGFQPTPRSSQR